ncbi:MAG: DUF502 domain-containing protein [Bauldia sp.]|nr:DUF502 domain-containing protein [Bauldia sp.]
MKSSTREMVVANTIYGLIALIPVAIIALIVWEVLKVLGEIAKPLALHSKAAAAVVVLAGLMGLLALCFAVGSAVRTRLGANTFNAIETRYLKRLPGYEPVANILRGFATKTDGYRPAIVSLFGPGTAVFGLVMEENADETLTVFVPSAPTLAVGTVHVVARDRVRLLEGTFGDFSGCVSQWGAGSRKLLAASAAGQPPPTQPAGPASSQATVASAAGNATFDG